MNTTTSDNTGTESFALRLSVYGYAFMALLGIGFAWLTRSDAIQLDGIYSLISFVMALLAQRVTTLVETPGSANFHFGFSHFEPLLNTVRGLLILTLCTFAMTTAIDALLHEGRPFKGDLAVFYGVGAAAICLLLAFTQNRFAKRVNSPTLQVDARNWLMDGMISAVVGLTFIVASLLENTQWRDWVPYIDPLLVVVLTVFMIRIPIMTVWENARELLMVAPEPSLQADIRHRVESALADIGPHGLYLRMLKMGRHFFVVVHLVLPEDYPCSCVADLDSVRHGITDALADIHPRLLVDAIITADENYAAGQV